MKKNKPIPPVTLRGKHKIETYEHILDCARTYFEKEGYDKTTIRKVAQSAGIGLGTVYQYFSKKEVLLAAAFYEDIDNIQEKAFKNFTQNTNIKNQLLYLAEQLFRFYAKRPELSKAYLKNILSLEGEWFDKIQDLDNRFLLTVACVTKDAIKFKEINKNMDCNIFAHTFFSFYIYTLYGSIKINRFNPDESIQLLDHLIDQHFCGISTSKNTKV